MRNLLVSTLLMLSLSSIAWSSPLERWHLWMAQHYAQQQQYAKARAQYEKIENPSDRVRYNLGNLLYREKKYAKAISQYMQIQSPALMHQRYHNIGNCLVALGETASAAKFYRNALKFAKHPDTLFNLTLVQRRLKEEEEAKKRELKESNETREFRDGSNLIDRYKEDNGTADLKDAKTPSEIIKKINSVRAAQEGEGGKIEIPTPTEVNSSKKSIKQENDRYEAQQWAYFFKKRTLKTLLIPLETPELKSKGISHDKNPY